MNRLLKTSMSDWIINSTTDNFAQEEGLSYKPCVITSFYASCLVCNVWRYRSAGRLGCPDWCAVLWRSRSWWASTFPRSWVVSTAQLRRATFDPQERGEDGHRRRECLACYPTPRIPGLSADCVRIDEANTIPPRYPVPFFIRLVLVRSCAFTLSIPLSSSLIHPVYHFYLCPLFPTLGTSPPERSVPEKPQRLAHVHSRR